MPRINVLHICKFYLPHAGGMERTIQMISENLKNENTRFKILTCAHNKMHKSADEVIGTTRVTRSSSFGTLFSTPLSIEFFIDFQNCSKEANILHLHSPFPLAEIACLLLPQNDKKIIISYQADISQTKWAYFAKFYKPILERLLARADCIIVTSPAMIKSSPPLHKFINKCKIIPLGIDINKWDLVSKEDKRDLKARLGIVNEKIILFVGRLVFYKGLDYLIKALKDINAILIIIGDGELKERLKKLATKLEVMNKIHFLGQVPEEELSIYYSIADVFVLPSINGGEAFALVQLEAMSFGLPVVNTDLPTGVPFVSLHNETGLTVPPRDSAALANAINAILENDELRQRFSKNALERVKLFSMERMLRDTHKVYQDVMDRTL